MIGLINLENSNIQSVINALDFLHIEHIVTSNKADLASCSKIILPGVGTFESGISTLHELELFEALKKEVLINNKPILGICLGMQMLFESSQESLGIEGLSLLAGKVVELVESPHYKIPRIGWGESHIQFDFLGLSQGNSSDFYYIHSYHVQTDEKIVAIISDEDITTAVAHKNIYGCQFHPEKSHTHGLNILKNFAELKEVSP